MQIIWKNVTGCQPNKPDEVDTTSSPTTVYLRRNIQQKEVTQNEETITVWAYEEAQLSLEEYRETMKGVYTTSVNASTLDEAPMAYKSLEDIIDVIRDSVDIIDVMRPVYNFKASD